MKQLFNLPDFSVNCNQRFNFLVREFVFRQEVANAINALPRSSKRQLQAPEVLANDVKLIAPCPCQEGGDLKVPLYVQGTSDGSALPRSTVIKVIDSAGDMLAMEVSILQTVMQCVQSPYS